MPFALLLVAVFAALYASRGVRHAAGQDLKRDAAAMQAEVHFEARVRPVLVEKCFRCHGGNSTEQGLRVDSREALLRGGERGRAIVPGNPEDSLLVQAIRRTHAEVQMPPDETLAAGVVSDIERWVSDGAFWPGVADSAFHTGPHWAWQPVQEVEPPADPTTWSDHPIDRFIAQKHRELGLRRVPKADRQALVRRLFFDLVGLPPTPEEVEAFLADDSPDALARQVDRLLESPHYGERWGRHWMDVVRYADTAGDNADYPVPEARLYRDYIIEAFNADKPYDQFVVEQLAGDLLARAESGSRYAELVTATGFLALSRRYATAPYEFWHLTLEDTIDTVGQAFLGLSLKCARCHDHKLDPITTADYYALYGIFDSTQYPWAGGEEFQSKQFHRRDFAALLPDEEAAPRLAAFQQQLAEATAHIGALEQQVANCSEAEKPALQKELDRLRAEHFHRQRSGLPPDVPAAYAVREGAPRDAAVQLKGDPGQPGPVVHRGTIEFFTSGQPLEITDDESGRMQLARWLVDARNPLTARVMVNRVWQQHFGRGLVETPSNFGVRGAPPSHPELLDYLAARFVADGWSIKALHRLILSSQTWQLAAADDDANARIDTGNVFLWRHDRRRLEAEAIRDAMFAVSGRLDRERPGAHPFPPPQDWHWTQHNPFKDVYASNHRSVYLMTQRIQRHPFLALFDGPDTNTSTGRRSVSTVPPQALYLMNSPEVQELATALAQRLVSGAEVTEARIDRAHRLCFGRPATELELASGAAYVRQYQAESASSGTAGDGLTLTAWASYAKLLLSSNEFIYVD
jgi:hypothetical protein